MADLPLISERLTQILRWLADTRTRVSPAVSDRPLGPVLGKVLAVQAELCRLEGLLKPVEPGLEAQLKQVISESYAKSADLRLALDKVYRLEEEIRRLRQTSPHLLPQPTGARAPGEKIPSKQRPG